MADELAVLGQVHVDETIGKSFTARTTRAIDSPRLLRGIPGLELMQRAAQVIWTSCWLRWPLTVADSISCGKGQQAVMGIPGARLRSKPVWASEVWACAIRRAARERCWL